MHIPAPVGGMNTIAAGTAMPDGDCPLLVNMLSGEYGLRVRLGCREYAGLSGVGNPFNIGRTLMGYHGSTGNGGTDKLFVATSDGIYDCSGGFDVAATKPITFAIQYGRAGYGIFHSFVTSAGHFLLYCDEENGYYVYSESTSTWTKVTLGGGGSQVSGVDPASFCFVTVWKSRVWFVEKNSKNAWYLTAGSIFGAATLLNLDRSAQFRNGGNLIGLWSWTLDGGIGVDDYLVAAASGGDVAVYQGTDPAAADTFGLKGTWNAGAFVAGRKIATTFGGDLLFITRSGPRALSQLVSGGDGDGTYMTGKIGNLFTRLAAERGDLDGWDMFIHPGEHALVITLPLPGTAYTECFAMSLWNRSWSIFRGLQMAAVGIWRKQVLFSWAGGGNGLGAILISDGGVDFLAQNPAAFDPPVPIQWQLLTAFKSDGGRMLKAELIRPTFLTQDGNPTWVASARYGYDISDPAAVAQGAASGSNSFDSGTWDSATWAADLGTTDQRTVGATGVGINIAIALRGASIARTVLVALDVFYKAGGYL